MKVWALLATVLLTATTAFSAGPSDIIGSWKTDGGDSRLELFRCGEKICGRIVWLKEPNYIDSKYGEVGTPVIDRKNPDKALQSRPVRGLRILDGFTSQGENTWGNGTCYDPKSGNTYRGKIHLVAPDRLELRGYVGIPFFGRSSVWTR